MLTKQPCCSCRVGKPHGIDRWPLVRAKVLLKGRLYVGLPQQSHQHQGRRYELRRIVLHCLLLLLVTASSVSVVHYWQRLDFWSAVALNSGKSARLIYYVCVG